MCLPALSQINPGHCLTDVPNSALPVSWEPHEYVYKAIAPLQDTLLTLFVFTLPQVRLCSSHPSVQNIAERLRTAWSVRYNRRGQFDLTFLRSAERSSFVG